MIRRRHVVSAILAAAVALPSSAAIAGNEGMVAVTITNLTRGLTLTPFFVASHGKDTHVFSLGEPASEELIAIAESGNIQPLSDKMMNEGSAYDIATNGALLGPGESTTITVKMRGNNNHISVASMLIPTNDAFIAVDNVKVPVGFRTRTVLSPAYDAGSETNDELCANIPGPVCGGEALSPNDSGEGYVHIHAGIHGIGDLSAATYDWRNPTAKIEIKRMK